MRHLVSGGQTGVDRAALDVARELGISTGGWCPAGRWAEDGRLAEEYPLRETFSSDPAQRTVWNAFDSDATLVISPEEPSGGTLLAAEAAERYGRAVLRIDSSDEGGSRAKDWLRSLPADIALNVAGPRESEWPGIYEDARRVIRVALAERARQRSAPRRVLVTGGAGCLGSELIRLVPPGVEVHATQRHASVYGCPGHPVDLGEARPVRELLQTLRPFLVIHTAYSTADLSRDVVASTRNVVHAARDTAARLVHLSTDMVLDGENAPFSESAEPAPVHAYGRAKAEAEAYVLERLPGAAVVRNSLITRFHPPDPRTEWVLAGLRDGTGPGLFVDEIRTPILVEDLARQIWEIARFDEDQAAGVWNLAGPEALSRYSLGTLIAAAHGFDPRPLRPMSSAGSPEPRPRDLRLLTSRAERELPTRARPLGAGLPHTAV